MQDRQGRRRYGELEYSFVKRLADSRVGRQIRRMTPQWARRAARSLLAAPTMASLGQDPTSFVRLLRMEANSGGADRTAEPRPVRLRALGGHTALLRPGTADIAVARDLFVSTPHLPPGDLLNPEPRRIWDLGSHIGLAAMHYAVRYPAATITAVELESMNAALCRRNLASLDGRCEVIEAAVWDTDGRVELDLGPSSESATVTNAFRVITGTDLAEGRNTASVEAISLNSLLARAGESAVIDYCKMDIEGAERQVLRHGTDWAERVAVILVEVHPPYTAEECHTDLERLGFRLAPTMQHRQGVVIASRP